MPNGERLTVRVYLSVLLRRKWVVVFTVIVVAGSALGYSMLQTPVYQAHARVLISPNQSAFQSNYGSYIDPSSIQTEVEILQAAPVRAAVVKRLGNVPGATASIVGSTAIIDVSAQSSNAAQAATVVTAYAEEYINLRRQQSLDGLLGLSTTLQKKIDDLQKQLDDANARAAAADAGKPPNTPPTRTPEQQGLESQKSAYKDKLDQLSVDSSLQNGGAQLVSPAMPPRTPISPTPKRNVALGVLVGLILGVGLAFLADQLDESIKDRDDLERILGDLPVLGVIPKVAGWRNRSEPRLVSTAMPNSSAAEAYRTLRTAIRFIGIKRPMRTIQITSPSAGEGKTTTTANLAVALTRAGHTATMVSCDLRRPRIHAFFGVAEEVGFTSVLLGTPLATALIPVPDYDGLSILPSGPLPPIPSELLSSDQVGEILSALESHSETVVIDCAPVLPVTDAVVLSARVDGTVLVVTAGVTTRKQLRQSLTLLRQVDAPVVGVVLNGASPEGDYGYEYGCSP
ncbi:MAG: polysaccharide biosynthesis tyrosine autokinase [Acidimicrobiales bacterium]